MTVFLGNLVATFGAPGITVVALFENLFPPTPSEYIYPLAGKMAYDGKVSLLAVVVAGTLGSLAGALIFYRLGYWLGEARAREAIARYGTLRVLGRSLKVLSAQDFDMGLSLFARYGYRIVFIARLMPFVHGVVSIPAGVVRMPLLPFMFYTALGASLWIGPLSLFGYWLGSRWTDVLGWLDVYQNVILAVIGLAIMYVVARRVYRRRANLPESS